MPATVYDPKDCVVFRQTGERWGELSTMAPGLAVEVGGIWIQTIEALYQACRYPHLPDVQRAIVAEHDPVIARRVSLPHRLESRADWARVRVPIMRWCLRLKLAHNMERFGRLLAQTGDRPIVEASKTRAFWGPSPGRMAGSSARTGWAGCWRSCVASWGIATRRYGSSSRPTSRACFSTGDRSAAW